MPRRPSLRRVTARTFWIGVPVLLIIAAVMLPSFLTLDTYRPVIQEELQQASGRRMTLGTIRAHLVPPGVMASHVVVFEREPPFRPIITADRVRLSFKILPLLQGKISIQTAAFDRPRVILYTDRLTGGPGFKSPSSTEATNKPPTLRVLIHQGRIELNGPFFGQTIRWAIDNVEGRVEGEQRRITLSARPSFLGPAARLTAILDPTANKPVHIELKKACLDELFAVRRSSGVSDWDGAMVDARADTLWPVMRRIEMHIDRLTIPRLPEAALRGDIQFSTSVVRARLQFDGLISSMTLEGRYVQRRTGWDVTARVDRYSPEIVPLFLSNYWIDALQGPGSITATVSRRGTQPPVLSLVGSTFTFAGTRFDVPTWQATDDGKRLDVTVKAQTPEGNGRVDVQWSQLASETSGKIAVSVSSITVGDVLDVFSVRPSTPAGFEPWWIREGDYGGLVHSDGRVTIDRADLTLQNLTVATSGEVDLSSTPARARFEGHLENVQLTPILESLGARPSPITGLARSDFDLSFAAEARWLDTLSGQLKAQSQNGFLRAGKTMYKIAGALNLNNLIKPSGKAKATADGIPYQSASSTATLTLGVLKAHDLKIRTRNMNIAATGEINLPKQTIDAKIELQFMQFMKDTLTSIPLVKRIVKPDTGFLQIPLKLRGKLDDPEIE